jgi:drug/metabolite transporter (DMT)-like permease
VPAGGLLIVAGISWIVLEQQRPADGVAPTTDVARGLVFAVAAALAWSMATVWLRGQQGNLDAIAAASLRIPAASVAVIATIALTAGASQQRPLAHLTRRSLAIVAIAGVLGTGLGSVLFIYAVEHTGAARTAFLTTTAPLFALPMGMFFLSEQLTPRLALGTVVTVAGIWLVLL